MTVPASTSKAGPYVCNGVQTVFPFGFRVLDASHVAVYVDGSLVTDGYSVSGGDVIFTSPPADGSTLAIIRATPVTQEVDWQNNTAFLPEIIETAHDKSVMIDQEIMEILSRCIKVAPTESDPNVYWVALNAIKDTCALSASNAATSAATAGTVAASIAHIWTELTGDETMFDAAFATAQELMEAKGAVDAAAAAAVAGVNDATLAALNAAHTEIEEAKDSSLVALDTALGDSTGTLTLLVAEAAGAKSAAEAAQAAAEASTGTAANSAANASTSATNAAASAVTSGNSAASAAAARAAAEAAQAAAVDAAADADDKAAIAAANSAAALSQAQAAAAAKVAAQEARTAAEAAAAAAVIDVNNAVAIHNGAATAHQTLFNAKAPLVSPALTGTPTAPTAAAGTNTTQLATTAFVANVKGQVDTALVLKAPLVSPALTGTPTAPTPASGDNSTKLATTAFVADAVATSIGGAQSLAANGYKVLGGGIIIQWGTITPATNADQGSISTTVYDANKQAFPIAFPNLCFALNATRKHIDGDGGISEADATLTRYDNTYYYIANRSTSGRVFTWIAIGY